MPQLQRIPAPPGATRQGWEKSNFAKVEERRFAIGLAKVRRAERWRTQCDISHPALRLAVRSKAFYWGQLPGGEVPKVEFGCGLAGWLALKV